MFHLNMFAIALFTSDVGFKHVSYMVVYVMPFYATRINFTHFVSARIKM